MNTHDVITYLTEHGFRPINPKPPDIPDTLMHISLVKDTIEIYILHHMSRVYVLIPENHPLTFALRICNITLLQPFRLKTDAYQIEPRQYQQFASILTNILGASDGQQST